MQRAWSARTGLLRRGVGCLQRLGAEGRGRPSVPACRRPVSTSQCPFASLKAIRQQKAETGVPASAFNLHGEAAGDAADDLASRAYELAASALAAFFL